MGDVVNASLAGGVAIGTYSNLEGSQFFAIAIGFVAGIISTIGFETIAAPLYDVCGIHDTCGVCWLHLVPGIFGTLVGVVAAATAGDTAYGESIEMLFPARAERDASE